MRSLSSSATPRSRRMTYTQTMQPAAAMIDTDEHQPTAEPLPWRHFVIEGDDVERYPIVLVVAAVSGHLTPESNDARPGGSAVSATYDAPRPPLILPRLERHPPKGGRRRRGQRGTTVT